MGFAEDTRLVLDRLREHGIEHMLVGALALDALGSPRTTVDVDIQISLPQPLDPHQPHFLDLTVEERTRDPVFDQDVLITHRPTSPIPIEFFVTTHWFCRQALARRQDVASPELDRTVPVPTPEDFVLLKAAFMTSPVRSRRKRAQDALDIEGVWAVAADPDEGYVKDNAERLGVWGALGEIIHEAA